MFRSSRFSAVPRPKWWPHMVQISRLCRETLYGRLKKRLDLSKNDRVLEVGPFSSSPDYFSHLGPKWAELGHPKEVGLGKFRLPGIFCYFQKLFLMATCSS